MLRSLVKRSVTKRSLASKITPASEMAPAPVLFNVQETARVVTLNRPKKLNALNRDMSLSIFHTLKEYAKSESAQLIVVRSSSEPRALCAGGDVAAVAECNLAGDFDSSIALFQAEYSLDFQLATYPKPVVAFMDGITMGGGVGVSVHNPFRVATENTRLAMPEMDIGFFPDVGSTFALPRLISLANGSAQMALYLVLTGEVLTGEEVYLLGLASHYVPHSNLDDLQARLGELVSGASRAGGDESFYDTVNEVIEEFSTPLRPGNFRFTAEKLRVIESCFDAYRLGSIQALFAHLERVATDQTASDEARRFAAATRQRLLTKSPTSMQVALRLIQENGRDSLENAVKRDLCTAANFCLAARRDSGLPVEFSQAVAHKLIDKQKNPYPWRFRLEDLSPSQLISLVSPKPSVPLTLLRNTRHITFKQYPHHQRYQLPHEQQVVEYAVGPKGGQDHAPQMRRHVLNHFTNSHGPSRGKVGTDLLVDLILAKNCNEDPVTKILSRR